MITKDNYLGKIISFGLEIAFFRYAATELSALAFTCTTIAQRVKTTTFILLPLFSKWMMILTSSAACISLCEYCGETQNLIHHSFPPSPRLLPLAVMTHIKK